MCIGICTLFVNNHFLFLRLGNLDISIYRSLIKILKNKLQRNFLSFVVPKHITGRRKHKEVCLLNTKFLCPYIDVIYLPYLLSISSFKITRLKVHLVTIKIYIEINCASNANSMWHQFQNTASVQFILQNLGRYIFLRRSCINRNNWYPYAE